MERSVTGGLLRAPAQKQEVRSGLAMVKNGREGGEYSPATESSARSTAPGRRDPAP